MECRFKSALELSDGMISMGYLSEGRKGFMGGLSKMFGNQDNAVASPGEAAAKADIYIAVNASTIELPDVEKYVAEYVGDKPIVLWNLELDTLRADLGEAAGTILIKQGRLASPVAFLVVTWHQVASSLECFMLVILAACSKCFAICVCNTITLALRSIAWLYGLQAC